MAHEQPMKQTHFVCFGCRKMFRKTLPRLKFDGAADNENLKCAECGGRLVKVGRTFKPPRQHDIKGWKQMEAWYTPSLPRPIDDRRLLSGAKCLKAQQRLQKQQERLASRSRHGRSLTNVSAPT